ncbi:MAG TPA: biotin/lipoyl-binding protein, partial [Parvularculaceae bacterium]|nr:biotin/lipoyl-binding protein [Parvularculaceae bacterium]
MVVIVGAGAVVMTTMSGPPTIAGKSAQATAAPAKASQTSTAKPQAPGKKGKPKPEPNIQLVTAITVEPREFKKTAPVSGEARPVHDIRVFAPQTGARIAEVLAEIGDEVKEGQPLARLDAGLVEAQIDEAEAQVRTAEIEAKRAADEYARIGPDEKDAALSKEE